jgi:DNA polymerase-3 subunit gamma/tau
VFILATTEAHKVLPTIVSRTQRFDFRRATVDVLQPFLEDIAKKEGIDVEPAALNVLARHGEGSFRDALSALDQLSSFTGSVSAEEVESLLGERNEDTFVELFDAIAAGDVGAVFAAVHIQIAQGADPRQMTLGALEHARSLLLLRTAPDAEELLDVGEDDRPILLTQSARFTPGALVRTTDLLAKSLVEMRNAPNHRLLLEVALVRSAAPETDPSATGLLGRIERLERRMGIEPSVEAPAPAPQAAPQTAPRARPAPQPAAAPSVPAAPQAHVDATPGAPRESAPPEQTPEPAAEPAEPAPPPVAPIPAEVGLSAIKDAWPATLAEVKKAKRRVAALLEPSRPVSFDGERLVVEVQSNFHVESMSATDHKEKLAEALYSALGIGPRLEFVERDSTPAPAPAVEEVADLATSTEVSAEHDPIELVKRGLGAEVVEEKPTTR